MDIKTIHSKAAGVLRKVLNTQQPAPTPGDTEPKPVEPAAPAEPTDKTTN